VAASVATLTSRELDVLKLVARGLSNKEIAAELTLSVPTVKTHVHNLLHKLGARRRADAGRLLHVAASRAVVEARTVRHLGVVGREPREQVDRISGQTPAHSGDGSERIGRRARIPAASAAATGCASPAP
jgi:DNA-binding CsgD family transcriptional regulator